MRATDERLLVVSSDGHVGPRISDLRPYCERRDLADFDEWAGAVAPGVEAMRRFFGVHGEFPPHWNHSGWRNAEAVHRRLVEVQRTDGHFDPTARLRDLEQDGIAAEVLFHASLNGEPMPFQGVAGFRLGFKDAELQDVAEASPQLQAAGFRIYNRWLADFCSAAPGRFVGLAHIPIWDVEACVREVEWAREVGLRGIHFPSQRFGLPAYNDRAWDPLWGAAVAAGLPLVSHGGGAPTDLAPAPGPEALGLTIFDVVWFGRRSVWYLTCGGVFERFPELKLVTTEQMGNWLPPLAHELDSLYENRRFHVWQAIPRPPSEYIKRNVFVGASFMSHFEAQSSIDEGLVDNYLWGADYPHSEGTWPYTELSLRKTLAGIPVDVARKLVGLNAVSVFDLPADVLTPVAQRSGPRVSEITRPLGEAELPEECEASYGFREHGPFS